MERNYERMTDAYDKVIGDFDLTSQEGLTEVFTDPGDEIINILLFGTIWITLSPNQAEVLRDELVKASR